MPSCLGLYIDSKIIKYAKVTKDKNSTKIDSFGLKTYENLQEAVNQIVSETSSYKIPISVNLSNEEYYKMKVFSMLSPKDIENVIKTEFESICEEKNRNRDAFDYHYILADDVENSEKLRVITAVANKIDITNKLSQLEGKRVAALTPLGVSIANLLKTKKKENVLIVNIEENTTVTTIVDGKIYDIETMEVGASDILESINRKENSYSKAYETCKNATIYTNENRDVQYEENQYIDEIMPTLYDIVGRIRKITNESLNRINKIYITGTASVINNIDIYFQEYLTDIECEILKPYFVRKNNKINIKDYIEVNSAISLALVGLGEGITEVNFKRGSFLDKLTQTLNIEIGEKKDKESKKEAAPLNYQEKKLLDVASVLGMILLVYIILSFVLTTMMNHRQKELDIATNQMQMQLGNLNRDKEAIKNRSAQYTAMMEGIQQISQSASENQRYKNTIPTLLSEIMFVVPKNIQLVSIENTADTHIVIKAQAEKYEQLGYFIGRLKTDHILTNVVSDSGQKQEGIIVVTIEGELP